MNNSLKIHGWFYHFEKSMVYEWNEHEMEFQSIALGILSKSNAAKLFFAHENS